MKCVVLSSLDSIMILCPPVPVYDSIWMNYLVSADWFLNWFTSSLSSISLISVLLGSRGGVGDGGFRVPTLDMTEPWFCRSLRLVAELEFSAWFNVFFKFTFVRLVGPFPCFLADCLLLCLLFPFYCQLGYPFATFCKFMILLVPPCLTWLLIRPFPW